MHCTVSRGWAHLLECLLFWSSRMRVGKFCRQHIFCCSVSNRKSHSPHAEEIKSVLYPMEYCMDRPKDFGFSSPLQVLGAFLGASQLSEAPALVDNTTGSWNCFWENQVAVSCCCIPRYRESSGRSALQKLKESMLRNHDIPH